MSASRIISIVILCFVSTVFVFGIIGYFIFRSRVKTKKTAVKLKRQLKKNVVWWSCCWVAWLLIGFMYWNAARIEHNSEKLVNFSLMFIAGVLITILLLLDFFIGKFAYITSQRVYFPDNFGLARNKKNVMYKFNGNTLQLWFNNGIMPKEFSVPEKEEELRKLLKDNYKLNKTV